MTGIFSFFGSILGYLLWFLFTIFKNYGVAIILFTIIMKIFMFPMSLKQQWSMASQSKLAEKQKDLQKKYANNKEKYNEELMKLYDKEGVNPSSGCLTTLIPFPIMLGIFYSVAYPLSNTLHIAQETVQLATDYISKIPGVVSMGGYTELEIIRNFDMLRDNLTMFTQADVQKIEFFTQGFRFLGLDLLSTPQGSGFGTFLWIIPVLSLVTSFGFQFYTMRAGGAPQGQQQGCMKVMMFALPLMSVYWAYIFPAAVGLYWVVSSLAGYLQMLVTNKFFSVNHMTAMAEARRAAALQLGEGSVRPLSASAQKEMADKLSAMPQQSSQKDGGKQPVKSKKKKKGGSGSGDTTSYMGSKK